jgi:CubicO group peptidase (beta-lactamase class C family)
VARSDGNPELFDPIRQMIRARLVEQGVPSLAVAVARDGKILWEEGFGWADRERRVPATEHTMYSLASISKPITATGLMVLAEQGKLDLDRPINEYLGSAGLTARVCDGAVPDGATGLSRDGASRRSAPGGDGATVRQVANHTSGLPLHYHFFPVDQEYAKPPMEETIRRYGNLVTAPGERYQYSNLGYGVLDHLIARLSGRSYAEFMRAEVFLPLGMARASVGIGPGLEPFAATRYWEGTTPLPFYDFDHPGGSAVFCSAHDLVRFGMFHLKMRLADQKAILQGRTIDAMQTPTSKPGEPSGYGVGWSISADKLGYHMFGHGGNMSGVTTDLNLVPSEKLAVVTLANANCSLPWSIAEDLLSLLLPEYAARREERDAREKEKREREQAEELAFAPPPELLGSWSGQIHTYRGEQQLALEFKETGDIHAQIDRQPKTLVNDAAFRDGTLTGRMFGEIDTEDARRRLHRVHLDLRLRGDLLNGAVIAMTTDGRPLGNALSCWAELKRSS